MGDAHYAVRHSIHLGDWLELWVEHWPRHLGMYVDPNRLTAGGPYTLGITETSEEGAPQELCSLYGHSLEDLQRAAAALSEIVTRLGQEEATIR